MTLDSVKVHFLCSAGLGIEILLAEQSFGGYNESRLGRHAEMQAVMPL